MPEQDRLLASTLRKWRPPKSVESLAQAWKAGDAAAIERLTLADMKAEPVVYQRLLVDRNRTWLPKIEALFSPARHSSSSAQRTWWGATVSVPQLRAKGYSGAAVGQVGS